MVGGHVWVARLVRLGVGRIEELRFGVEFVWRRCALPIAVWADNDPVREVGACLPEPLPNSALHPRHLAPTWANDLMS